MACKVNCFKSNYESVKLEEGNFVDEVEYFAVCVESSHELKNCVLLITDIPIELKFISAQNGYYYYILREDSVKEYFRTQDFDRVFDVYKKDFYIGVIKQNVAFYKLFVNYPVGKSEIIIWDNENESIVSTTIVNIISSKVNTQEFALLVSFVESKGSSIWSKYSLIKHEAEGARADSQLDWVLIFLEDFLQSIENDYLSRFKEDPISVLIPRNRIDRYDSETPVSEISITWLLENLDVLKFTVSHDANKIIVSGKPFIPTDIFTEELFASYDTPENQVVHGFVSEIKLFLAKFLVTITKEIDKGLPSSFEEQILYYSLQIRLKKLQSTIEKVKYVDHFLLINLPVSRHLYSFAHLNKIESKEHYYYVYTKFLEWLNNKNAMFSNENRFFKGVSRLDELFERACFYQLIDALVSIGYKVELPNNFLTNTALKVKLSKDSLVHYLFYQRVPDSLATVKKGSRNLLPDFILDLGAGGCVIIDAKYKKEKNIVKYDYPELVLKYLHGLGPENGGRHKTNALLICYPDKFGKYDFYQKNTFSLTGSKPVFPIIGKIGINFEEQRNNLIEVLSKLFDVLL